MNEPLISIVVPVYNVEGYLEKCLESLVHQTYRNLEILLVDDGSTDSSGAICDRYAENDGRIRVIHKENGGLSDARNAGMRIARGEWILFVDSDDFISPDACAVYMRCVEDTQADIVVSSEKKFFDESECSCERAVRPTEVINSEEALIRYYYRVLPGYAWGKLYRREVVSEQLFPVGKLFEDMFWVPRILERARSVALTQEVLYFYRQRAGSIVQTTYTSARLDALEAVEIMQQRYEDRSKEFADAVRSKRFVTGADLLGRIHGIRGVEADRERIKQALEENRVSVFRDRRNSFLVRTIAFMAMMSLNLVGWCSAKRNRIQLRGRI